MRECVMDMRGRGHAGGENAGVWQAGQRQTRIAPPPDRIHSPSRCPLRGRVLGSAERSDADLYQDKHTPRCQRGVFLSSLYKECVELDRLHALVTLSINMCFP